jgi:hypothetical protein
MTDRRGSRFLLEVLFLLGLTVALTLANLRPLEIAGVMLIGWVIVALLEWVAWRDEPHYGSGLPPRYYVPQVSLPPAQPLEQVSAGYPEAARDEAPTWIASPALRAEMLGEWPVATAAVDEPAVEAVSVEPLSVDSDPWTQAEELPAAPLGELDPAALEPSPPLIPPPVSVPAAAKPVTALPERVRPALDVELVRSAQRVARYNLDPLADPQPRRRFGRVTVPEPEGVEVPARPEGARALPGHTNRQD